MTREAGGGSRPAATLELMHEGSVVLVQAADVVVGRTAKCTVRVVHPLVSREHCRLELRPDGLHVVDLGSVNGTWLDGERVEARARVRAGAKLGLGRDGAVLEVRRAVLDGIDVSRIVRQEDLRTMVAGDPRAERAVARVEVAEDAAVRSPAPDLVPTRALGEAARPSSSAALLEAPEIPVVAAMQTVETSPLPETPAAAELPSRGFAPGFVVGFVLGLVAVGAAAVWMHAFE